MDYTNIKNQIEEELGGNALDTNQQEVNPYTGEPISNNIGYIQPKDYPALYRGDNPLEVDTSAPKLMLLALYLDKLAQLKKNPENQDKSQEELEEEAYNSTYGLQAVDSNLEVDKYIHADILKRIHNERAAELPNIRREQQKQLMLENLFKVSTVNKEDEDENEDRFKDWKDNSVDFLSRAFGTTRDEMKSFWEQTTNENRKGGVVSYIGSRIYEGDELEEFNEASPEKREQMLANTYVSSRLYKSLSQKLKEGIAETKNEDPSGISDWIAERPKKIMDALSNMLKTHQVLYKGAEATIGKGGANLVNAFTTPARAFLAVGGLASLTLSAVANFAVGTGKSIGEFTAKNIDSYFIEDSDVAEESDAKVKELANKYILEKADGIYRDWMLKVNDGDLSILELVKQWDDISKNYSAVYNINEGTPGVRLADDYYANYLAKVRELAKFAARLQTGGGLYAINEVDNFYKDLVNSKESLWDYTTKTFWQFTNNMAADGLSLAAIAVGLGKFVVPLGEDPYDEGFTDYLMHDPWLLKAVAILETGCWDEEEQKKYRELGVNKYEAQKSTALENSALFVTAADLPSLIGQYGFTAATAGASIIGSGLISTFSKLGRGSLGRLIGSLEYGIGKKVARGALKIGLITKEPAFARVSLSEFLAGALQRRLFYGNLTLASMLGTAEGGLEAKSTYNTFLELNFAPLFNEKNGRLTLLFREIDSATPEQLEEYMASQGYQKSLDGRYTEEQYATAQQELRNKVNTLANEIKDKIEEEALDAACANFILNSCINGALNVTLKQSLLSNDMKEAVRAYRGNKALSSYVTIVEDSKGKFKAVAKSSIPKNNTWKERLKGKFINTKLGKVYKIGARAVPTALGEGVEEYTQGISDAVSRAAFQADMNNYMETVLNDEARNAYTTDFVNILTTGLNEINTLVTNIENIKEGFYGFLSTLIGGVSPVRFGASLISNTRDAYKEKPSGFKDKLKTYGAALGKSVLSGFEGAIFNNYREARDELYTEEHLADAVNTWLENSNNLEIFTHLGGAIGFRKKVVDSMIQGDKFNAKNDMLSLAIENIIMMESLKDTKVFNAYATAIDLRYTLGNDAEFDENGNYIDSGDEEVDRSIHSAINEFKNREGNLSRSTLKNDKEILARIRLNAREFKELRLKVLATESRLKKVFKQKEIDPLVLNALTHAFILSEEAQTRAEAIKENTMKAVSQIGNLQDNAATPSLISGINKNIRHIVIKALSLFGSLEGIDEAIKALNNQIGQLADLGKTTSYEYREAVKARSSLASASSALKLILEQKQAGDKTISLTQLDILFTANDLIELGDFDTIALVVINSRKKGSKISSKQKEEVDKLLQEILKIQSSRLEGETISEDFDKTVEDVAEDFIDYQALMDKSIAYESNLLQAINEPSFLSSAATKLRTQQRAKSLKRIYKELFNINKGETLYDMLDRVEAKRQILIKEGKTYDAEILKQLANSHPLWRKYNAMRKMVYKAVENYKKKHHHEVMKEGGELVIARAQTLLMTLAVAKNMSFSDLLLYFKSKGFSLQELTDIIKANQKVLETEGARISLSKEALEMDTDNQIAEVANKARDILNSHEQALEEIKAKTTPPIIKKELPPVLKQDKPNENPPKPNTEDNKKDEPIPSSEPVNLPVITFGDLDPSSAEFQYLKENHADETLKFLTGPEGTTESQDVKNRRATARRSIIIYVIKDNDRGTFITAVGYMDNSNKFHPFGVLKGNESKGLNERIEKCKTVLNNPKNAGATRMSIKGSDGRLMQINTIGNVTPVQDLAADQGTPLNLEYTTEKDRTDFVETWSKEGRLEGGKTHTYFKSTNGYEVEFATDASGLKYVSIFDLIVGGQSLSDLLKSNATIAEKIAKLKEFQFFRLYFSTWTNHFQNASLEDKVKWAYANLIRPFIYLGKVSVGNNVENIETTTETRDGLLFLVIKSIIKLTPSGGGLVGAVSSTVYKRVEVAAINLDQSADKIEEEALKALISIDSNRGVLLYTNPMIDFEAINSKSKSVKLRFVNNMAGLIELGWVLGHTPTAVKAKNTSINNPFFGVLHKSSGGPSSSNTSKPLGQVTTKEGAVVDTATQLEVTNILKNLTQRALNYVTAKVKNIKKNIEEVVKDLTRGSEGSEDPNATGDENYSKGKGTDKKEYARTTAVESALVGAGIASYKGAKGSTKATALGNTIDVFVRAVIQTFNSLHTITLGEGKYNVQDNQLMKDLKSTDPKVLDKALNTFLAVLEQLNPYEDKKNPNRLNIKGIKNLTPEQSKDVILALVKLYSLFDSLGWTVIPKDVRVFGSIPIVDLPTGSTNPSEVQKVGYLPTAGTLDLLVCDNEGVFHIIDVKTIGNRNSSYKAAMDERKHSWSGQVSIYLELCAQTSPNIRFGLNYILPIFLEYFKGSKEIKADGLTITGEDTPLLSSPKTLIELSGKADKSVTNLEDVLYPIEMLDKLEFKRSALSLKHQAMIVPVTSLGAPLSKGTTSNNKEGGTGSPSVGVQGRGRNSSGFRNYSERTEKESRFTNFINARIAPLSTYRVAIISRIFNFIRKVGLKSTINQAIEADLATTFFNGDLYKYKEIIGQETNERDAYTIISKLKDYFDSYISKKETYRLTMIQRHYLTKALYLYLKGEINQNQFEEVVLLYGTSAVNIIEYVLYTAAEDKEKAASEIIKKLEQSELLQEEIFLDRLEAFDRQVEDMEMKLEFLNNTNAYNMLISRMNSVEQAILKDLFSYKSCSKNNSIDNILSGKEELFSGREVLIEIRSKSKSRYMKMLASAILSVYTDKGSSVILNVVRDESNSNIEGSFDGTVINIYPSALKSYETLERVILHEMLHFISKDNTIVKEKLSALLDRTVEFIMEETGQTEELVKQSTYGLKDVDEFISEFFTNFAFLESLKEISDKKEKYDSIFDRILHFLKLIFTRRASLYKDILYQINQIISVSNVASSEKTTHQSKTVDLLAYENLSMSALKYLELLGIEKTEYNNFTRAMKQVITECAG